MIGHKQEYKSLFPASGKVKLNRANKAIKDFVDEVFNSNGEIKNLEYPKQVSKWNCTFCLLKKI